MHTVSQSHRSPVIDFIKGQSESVHNIMHAKQKN